MPRLLTIGHVTRDRRPDGDVLGGSPAYGALAARRLGWEVGVLTAADVFAAAFLVRYHGAGDPLDAAALATGAATCAVEGVGASSLGDGQEVLRRLEMREPFIEEGDWDE